MLGYWLKQSWNFVNILINQLAAEKHIPQKPNQVQNSNFHLLTNLVLYMEIV